MDEWVICYKKIKKTSFRVHGVKTLPAAPHPPKKEQ